MSGRVSGGVGGGSFWVRRSLECSCMLLRVERRWFSGGVGYYFMKDI